MRILCGLGIAALVAGSLAAQHHGGSSPSHSGASNGARWSGTRSASRFSGGTAVFAPYAYPVAFGYGYSAPQADQAYTDAGAAPADAGVDYAPSPQYTAPPEPTPHGLILNFEDSDAPAATEPAHYYIALKDRHVYLAVAYLVEGDTLHYFLAGNTHNQVSLSLVDYDLTQRLNRESGTEVRLPARK